MLFCNNKLSNHKRVKHFEHNYHLFRKIVKRGEGGGYRKITSSENLTNPFNVCRKVHPTPSACVSDRTKNDRGSTSNYRLTLGFSQTFAIHLANVCQKLDQLILIYFDLFTYKYPPPSPSSSHLCPF